MDGRKNNSGKKGNPGNTKKYGHGHFEFLKQQVDKYSPVFWKELGRKMEEGNQWALSEFNKIQIKMIPQDVNNNVQGDLKITWQNDTNDNNTLQTEKDSE